MRNWRKYLLSNSAVLGAMLLLSAAASATPQAEISDKLKVADNTFLHSATEVNTESKEGDDNDPMAQVTSVSQLSDVQPTDWAFQALQSLVERYGCIAGYPDGTYRGNRALTRYEFAAGLNACLDRVNELIATATADLVTREDLATLQRLQEEFAAELATLRGRVDVLEARTAELEANQFSTTTKLDGQVVIGVTDVLAGDSVNGQEITDKNTVLGARSRVNLETSFTGEDLLLTRLQAQGLSDANIGTLEGDIFFAEEATNDIEVDALLYSFPLGKRTRAIVIANAGAADDLTNTVNIFDGDGAAGALSTFGTRNPIYYLMDGAGLGITQEFSDNLELSLGYLAAEPNSPGEDTGLFNGPYGALAQLTIKPSDRFNIGLTYIHSYNNETGTGSNFTNARSLLQGIVDQQGDVNDPNDPSSTIPFNDFLASLGISSDIPIVSNSFGAQLSWQLSDNFVFGGWVGYTNTRNLSTLGGLIDRGEIDIFNAAITLGFPDLGKQGNLGGIIVGIEPKVTNSSIEVNPAAAGLLASAGVPALPFGENNDTSLHIEAFYQYQLTDNIAITPGVIWLTAPDHNANNDDVVIGAIRTTFSF